MKWDEMKPARRDALVAEKIMGLQVVTQGGYSTVYDYQAGLFTGRPLPYTQSMDAAWQVFQHMMQHYYPLRYQFLENDDGLVFRHFFDVLTWFDDQSMAVYGDEIYPSESFFEIVAKWTPELICKAALKAVGVKIE